ncbi:MAG: chromosomal replication initiator protein DnaA [Rhodospirillaceae bacterium]|jgi:chromosomal replication initiator protein|nr:chromosomal replication initiator protein DnaA [Rhodospirillaceae bacterium]MBT7648278.1 chromosomal replication initiator protein DnaA [Rhodospirillaceae bacterium]
MASEPVKMDQDVEDQWKRVRGRLRAELGEAAFKTWLRPLSLDGVSGNEVVMRVPSGNMKDWVMSRCGERLHDLWCGENESVTGIMIKVGKPERRAPRREVTPVRRDLDLIRHDGNALDASAEADQLAASLDPRFTFENFVVGKTNEFAHAAAQRVAAADSVTFNPLFLYGGVGLGKTHLMHAIAWHIRTKKPGRRVLYMSAEKFMYKFIRAIRYKDTMAFKDQFRAVDVLMIDDIQFIAGKDSTQEEFFHTFNALVDQNRQVVISGDRSPSDLDGMEERLRSRLGWGLVADIHPADYELRLGILETKASQFPDVVVPQRVMEFLAHKISSNVRELEGALNRVLAHAQLVGQPITLDSTQELLRDLLRAQDRRVTIEEIQKKVAEHFNIRMADMVSARKQRAIARPRQIAMYLAKRLTSRSLPEIGRKFGGRDHTTVMHGVRKVEELMAGDHAFAEDVELLERMLES